MIPFSPPRIDERIIAEVVDTLRSGWITTGPKTKEFEKRLTDYCGNGATLAVNSATSGLELVLRWFGIKEGDEVILPAYTYCATANVVIHCGAKPVMVDVNSTDFNINV
ncbi:MAG: aminotransferase class I/II-fold pyridoxal phosphate-dependent enzyme, partial [Bacteroidales bacterium]